jgi:cephalosporin hydroxylase
MRETYKNIPGDMCDFHKYYERIANWLPNDCRIVEVGVADGHSAIYLAEILADMNKKFHLYMVESMAYGGTDQANTIIQNIVNSGLGSKITLLQMSSLDASCKWPDNWAHFVFLDSSHTFEQTKAEVRQWYRKVMHGHILAGHDYNQEEGKQVYDAVNEVIGDNKLFKAHETEKNLGVWSIKKETESLC